MKKLIWLFSFSILTVQLISQTNWSVSPFDQKVFIENKGQFDGKIENTQQKVYFGTRIEGVDLYFTSNGLVYRHDEWIPMTNEEREEYFKNKPFEKEEKGKKGMKINPQYLAIEWEGANSNTEIISEEKVQFYYTYGGQAKNIPPHL